MLAIAAVGLLIFFGSLIYLAYHFVRKIKNSNRILPKKPFYSALIGGLLLFIVGAFNMDTSVQVAFEKAQEENIELIAKNEEMQTLHNKLIEENSKLLEENKNANKEIDELVVKLDDSNKLTKELTEKQTAHEENNKTFEQEITDLTVKNTALTSEVSNLKGQVASMNTNATVNAASNKSDSSSGSSVSKPSQQSSTAYYKNCTAARAAGAAPVYRGDPGYGKHLDRDGDGVGCE
ncbi:excalibur calcium-binding domain-containing protein [Sporosarcina newyorkensis]|uniref:Excalibur calcium-binding domain-containing protein n=1 Tax=Sporosarcina newyorkensis TaxID=759851 RepID=A0A1T4XSN3_9BACL|nr:excalibur calcium-binding domain-containing protein [Sporosarcina newyorkensis]SKA92148.1 Excalibur calcium-binding domain-containing protein [Sporosarcina newyorkensis]